MRGESIIYIKPGYRLMYMLPCVKEKGKKMAEARINLKIPPEKTFPILEKTFPETKLYPDLPAARIDWKDKEILIHTEQEKGKNYAIVKITRALDKKDVIETTEFFIKLFTVK